MIGIEIKTIWKVCQVCMKEALKQKGWYKEMTNEELALHIADGNKDLIGELYQQNKGLLYKYAYRFYILHSERCAGAGITLDDMMNECYFAVYTAAKSYAKGNREYRFTSYLHYSTLQYFQQMAGIRTKQQRKEPLNSCKSLDTSIEDTDGLMLADTVEDIEAAEKTDILIDRLAYSNVFPEVKRILADEPEKYNTVYAIYHDNISMVEWAKITGVTPEAVRQQKQNALRLLRRSKSKYLRSLYEDVIESSYQRSGLNAFKNTKTSSVEWAVMKIDEVLHKMIEEVNTEFSDECTCNGTPTPNN